MSLLNKINESNSDKLVDIELELINNNELNDIYNIDNIEELAENIAVNGQIDPIIVYLKSGEYTIISGHRRFEALKSIDKEFAKCILVPKPETIEEEKILLVEANSQRVKTKEELKSEIVYKKESYTKLKNQKHPKYVRANINKLIASETGVSLATVKRTIAEDKDTIEKKDAVSKQEQFEKKLNTLRNYLLKNEDSIDISKELYNAIIDE
ncbi:MAG: ParB/RepB/Spo0J family partition protein [Bacilli bacterium]